MKALQIRQYGDTEQLVCLNAPRPSIQDHELLIQVAAVSINPVDFKIRSGAARHVLRYRMPLTLGHDFAGTVAEVGKKVKGYEVGDHVYGRTKRTGTMQTYVVVDEQDIAHTPHNLSLVEAASVPLVALTAYQGIHQWLELKKGQTILITGGAGGVGHVAIQLAKLAGAHVVTTASNQGMAFLQRFGVDRFIDYKREAFRELLTDVDAVFDMQGKQDLADAFKVVKHGGRIASIAALPTPSYAKAAGWGKMLVWGLSLMGRKYRSTIKEKQLSYDAFLTQSNHEQLMALTRLIEHGSLHVAIEQVYPWTEVNQAMDKVKQGRVKGKIVVDMSNFE